LSATPGASGAGSRPLVELLRKVRPLAAFKSAMPFLAPCRAAPSPTMTEQWLASPNLGVIATDGPSGLPREKESVCIARVAALGHVGREIRGVGKRERGNRLAAGIISTACTLGRKIKPTPGMSRRLCARGGGLCGSARLYLISRRATLTTATPCSGGARLSRPIPLACVADGHEAPDVVSGPTASSHAIDETNTKVEAARSSSVGRDGLTCSSASNQSISRRWTSREVRPPECRYAVGGFMSRVACRCNPLPPDLVEVRPWLSFFAGRSRGRRRLRF